MLLLLFGLLIQCAHQQKDTRAFFYFPDSKKELERNGYERTYMSPIDPAAGPVHYERNVNDTFVTFYYRREPEDGHDKEIRFYWKKVDSVSLFNYFKQVDDKYTDTSTTLTVKLDLNKTITYKINKSRSQIQLYYDGFRKNNVKRIGDSSSPPVDTVPMRKN